MTNLMLYNNREPIVFLKANIHATRISVKKIEVMEEKLPEALDFLQHRCSLGDKCYQLSLMLTSRIPDSVKQTSIEDFHRILQIRNGLFSKEEAEQYLFLLSLLRGLAMDEDELSLHPLQTEYLRFFNKDERFTGIYRFSTI